MSVGVEQKGCVDSKRCMSVCSWMWVTWDVVQSETETQWRLHRQIEKLIKKTTESKLCGSWLETFPTEGQAWLWTGEAACAVSWREKQDAILKRELDWVILLQVQILTERRHHSKHVRALASVCCVSLAHSLHYLTHGNPLIYPPHLFSSEMKEAQDLVHGPSLCNHSFNSPWQLQQ